MALSWNEIKKRAIEFSREWADADSERAEKQSFWNDFFHVFGISRKRVATFEEPVKKFKATHATPLFDGDEKKHPNKWGFIDLFWKGTLLVEHKSKGKDLDKAFDQAIDYFPGIQEHELPKYILVSDFGRFRLYDLEEDTYKEFHLKDLHKNIHNFGFIAGYEKKTYKVEDPVNIKAAMLMGVLHDHLAESGYTGHKLELFLVRILFCLFADDTGIFEKNSFLEYMERNTKEDGTDLGLHLAQIFQVLNTPVEKRQKTLDENLAQFIYVNGKLFEEQIPFPSFDSDMREALLKCCYFDWSRISPAVFGSLFQSVMDKVKRRDIGAHYTSEQSILKVIKPLFLDSLYEEFEKIKNNRSALIEFHKKLGAMKFLDPACGCGNFLIITYRELRQLEIVILKILYKNENVIDVGALSLIDVDEMYGIEFEEFPARIAEVAMWLIDHQMNMRLSEEFGFYYVRLPLRKSAIIYNDNALRLDWEKIVSNKELSYMFGNPPFVGKQHRSPEQEKDMELIFRDIKGAGVLDYVTAWYIKAAQYIQGTNIKVAFVSTNSISQGEQVGMLWNELFNKYGIKIHFAHRTFKWNSEAKGKASVHVVIIGFANYNSNNKLIYDYDDPKTDAHELKVKNINPYLVEGKDFTISKRKSPICNVPEIIFGNMPNDGGHLLLTDDEKIEFIKEYPSARKFIRPLISAKEFLSGIKRWCLWLTDITPSELTHIAGIRDRVKEVRNYRQQSDREATRKLANFPALFGERRQPTTNYIVVPRHSSETRRFIPLAYMTPKDIIHDSCLAIPNTTLYHFGVLMSSMHMAWVKQICGRIKSDFRYSNELVYNNYPWPENPSTKNQETVEEKAGNVLIVRKSFPDETLAALYDPSAMPPALVKAHQELDKAVDLCYRSQPFVSDLNRIEFLFDLYSKYYSPLVPIESPKKKRRR